MITGVAHVCLGVRDLNVSEAFYRDALGLKHAFDFINEEGNRFGAYFHVGGRNFIELFEGDAAGPVEGQAYRHTCLEVDDIEKAVAELRSRCAEVTNPVLGSDGSWQAWTADPDGNRIELHQYTPESKQTPYLA